MFSMATFILFFPDFGFSGELAHILQSEGEGGVVSGDFSRERRCKEREQMAAEREFERVLGLYSLGVVSV
jgi:hypothetical protein